jgi:hypothetical protein
MYVCTMQDAGIDLQKSSYVVREATGYWPRPPTRLADGGDRAQDHVRDDLFILQSHWLEV